MSEDKLKLADALLRERDEAFKEYMDGRRCLHKDLAELTTYYVETQTRYFGVFDTP